MMKFYDKANARLVFVDKAADPDFWDSRWQAKDLGTYVRSSKNAWIVSATRKYLPTGSRILEGGCGRGDKLYALHVAGYKAFGVDYARNTVETINRQLPELQVTYGDLRSIPFEDGFFDGYWSLGVIEHFYDGFDAILLEMRRVIRRGGYLFLLFPAMSPLRKLKAALGRYEPFIESAHTRRDFYQFALDPLRVAKRLAENGFALARVQKGGSLFGLESEVACLEALVRWADEGKSIPAKVAERIIGQLVRPVANHTVLLVLSRT